MAVEWCSFQEFEFLNYSPGLVEYIKENCSISFRRNWFRFAAGLMRITPGQKEALGRGERMPTTKSMEFKELLTAFKDGPEIAYEEAAEIEDGGKFYLNEGVFTIEAPEDFEILTIQQKDREDEEVYTIVIARKK